MAQKNVQVQKEAEIEAEIKPKTMRVKQTLEPMYRSVDLTGCIIDCNEKYARMLGYLKDEVVGMSIYDHTPEDKHDIIRSIFEQWRDHTPINNHKFPLMSKDGKVFDVLITVRDVTNADGQVLRSHTTLLDYAEVRQMQEQVMLSKYESLYEDSQDMYRTVNINGIIVDCNRTYCKKMGLEKSEIIGRNLTDHTADRSVSDILINMAKWRMDGRCIPGEIWMKPKNGKEFPALVTPPNLYDDDGSLLGRNVVIQDMTKMQETKEMLEERQKIDQMKDEFLTGITHELKTPLTPIIGFTQALLRPKMMGDLNEKQMNAVRTVLSNAIHLRRLVSDMLDIHKLELGKMKFDYAETNIEDLMKKVVSSIKHAAGEKNIAVTLDVKRKGVILADHMRISEILNNLLYNAIDFSPEKDGRIDITVEDAEDGMVRFIVADNGVGIAEDKQARLFKKFYQVATAQTRRYGGTGLGLSICKALVDGMGGSIGVRSKPNEGSTFYFTIKPGGPEA